MSDMPPEYKQAYRIVADEMESQSDDQAVPLDMEQMQYYGGKLRVALQSRDLQPVPATSTAVAQAKAPKSDKTVKSNTTDALEARLRKLEQAIPPKPPDKRRGGVEVAAQRVEQPAEVVAAVEHRLRTLNVYAADRRAACPRHAQRATKKLSAS